MGPERGQMLSHYRLVEQIGAGGMGVVWKAEDTVLNRTVAIKILPADLAVDEKRRRMFLDEARLAASVSHGNIVQVHELGREGDVDFIIMEYVEGQPLNEVLHGRPLPPDKVADWGSQVAQGLARAHRKGLIHRDLKPANILVTPDNEAKIVDFGLAVLFAPRDSTLGSPASALTLTLDETRTRIAGTLPYMSPEQVLGEKLDTRSDIFSFGSVLYEMTTGRRPFKGTRPAEIVQEILVSRPQPMQELVPKVPLDLVRIIDKALARRPEDRYQGMDDVAVDLKRLRKDLESGTSSTVGAARHASPARRRRLARPVLLGGALVIAVGLGLLVQRRGGEPPAPEKAGHARSAIAVLPFQNLSAEGTHAYFASGLHDELLTQLAKVAALKVISRTSVMGYQSTSKPLKTIASELGVGSVVEGSVQVVGERLRVNVQLIDATTDEHLWAESYDRTLNDAFAIQSDVAQAIVVAVGAALTSTEQRTVTATPTANAEAYQLYLQGLVYDARPGILKSNLEIAQQLYERALALDRNFALAHAALSVVHGRTYWLRYDPSPSRAAAQRAEAMEALRLEPDLPRAHFAMGMSHYQGRREYQQALDEFQIAIEGLPNDAELWQLVGTVNRRLGNWDTVISAFEKAVQLDPRRADLYTILPARTYGFMRRYPEAVRAYDQALSLAPDLHVAAIERGRIYFRWQGQLDSLRAVLGRVPRDAEVGTLGSVAAQRAELLLWERNPEGLLQMLRTEPADVFDANWFFLPTALYVAWAQQLRGDDAAARAAFGQALARSDSALREDTDDWRAHVTHGMSLAALGRHDEALREARWLQASVVYQKDAFEGTALAEGRARILAQAGEVDAAIDELDRLLAKPSDVSMHALRLDPRWDSIREHPRFRALLSKYTER